MEPLGWTGKVLAFSEDRLRGESGPTWLEISAADVISGQGGSTAGGDIYFGGGWRVEGNRSYHKLGEVAIYIGTLPRAVVDSAEAILVY